MTNTLTVTQYLLSSTLQYWKSSLRNSRFFLSDFLEDRYTIDYQYAIATSWLDRGGSTSELFPVNNLRTHKKKAEELTVNRGRNSGKLFCTSTQNFQ